MIISTFICSNNFNTAIDIQFSNLIDSQPVVNAIVTLIWCGNI